MPQEETKEIAVVNTKMTQEEINEQFILTLESEHQLYYTTILREVETNLGLKAGG